jgi:RNA polymerase sigma factor (TIGR02999 family)
MPDDLIQLWDEMEGGNPKAAEVLLPFIYDELRRLARAKLAREDAGQTLQATALVHEAWLRLCGSNQHWNGRGHFFCAAAEAMRRILVDRARKKNRQCHGAGWKRRSLESVELATETDDETLLAINEALEKFSLESPHKAELVKLRFFAGLTLADSAKHLGISLATAKRHWAYARSWLLCELKGS